MSSSRWGGADSRKARAVCAPLAAQGGPCHRCRKPILPGQDWQPDHIVSRAEGGTNDPSNLWPSHSRCNMAEGGRRGVKVAQEANRRRRGRQTGTSGSPAGSFDQAEHPTLDVRDLFLLGVPELPDVRAEPTILSSWPDGTDISEAELGARWLGLPLFPQGVEIASVLQAVKEPGVLVPLYRTAVIEMARRSTKTTAALAVLLGRCLERPGYKVASTAQTGTKARAKLLEVQTALRAAGFESQGLGQCLQGMGDTRIRFANGSSWQSVPPDPSAFRQEAFDAVLVDEAGELEPERAQALLAGILPTMDTRPTAQIIVAGTPGEVRDGLLWTRLEQLRAGRPRVGGVVYEAPDKAQFIDVSDPDNPVVNWELLLRVHPGISCGLTDVETVVGNIEDMGLEKWCREYLCLWPLNAGVVALDVAAWEAAAVEEGPERPENAAVAWAVDKDGGTAAVVAAWRDEAGMVWLDVLAAGPGFDWLPDACRSAQAEHRGSLAYNSIGYGIEQADAMSRPPFRVRVQPVPLREQIGAAARIEKTITKRQLRHFDDPALTGAVGSSAWRPVGNARMFLSVPGSSALEAAALALWTWDQRNRGSSRRRVVSSAELERRRRERAA